MPPNLVDRLDTEWTVLASESQEAVTRWSTACAAFAGCAALSDLPRAIRNSPDEALGFLIGQHQAGEHLAGRVVLQTMLGKLVRMSYGPLARSEDDALDDLVTQMWCQIHSYPLARRPHRVAANLALDTLKATHKEWLRDGEIAIPPAEAAVRWEYQRAREPEPERDWCGDELIEAAYQEGLITATTRDILTAVYGPENLSGKAAADRYRCTPAAIRRRCCTAIRQQLTPLAYRLIA